MIDLHLRQTFIGGIANSYDLFNVKDLYKITKVGSSYLQFFDSGFSV